MTQRAEALATLVLLSLVAFLAYRTLEWSAWMNEDRYERGAERQALVMAHRILGG